MTSFPHLKTGVEAQYPLASQTQFATDVIVFMDGAEQRFARYAAPLRKWTIRLSLLDEGELNTILAFFRTQRGRDGVFCFTDPADGTLYPSCSFVSDSITTSLDATGRCSTVMVIQQNRS